MRALHQNRLQRRHRLRHDAVVQLRDIPPPQYYSRRMHTSLQYISRDACALCGTSQSTDRNLDVKMLVFAREGGSVGEPLKGPRMFAVHRNFGPDMLLCTKS